MGGTIGMYIVIFIIFFVYCEISHEFLGTQLHQSLIIYSKSFIELSQCFTRRIKLLKISNNFRAITITSICIALSKLTDLETI